MTRPTDPTDADLRDPVLARLGEGADLPPERRRALLDRIAPAGAAPRPTVRRLRLRWVGAAAAAALVAAVVGLWPTEPEPVSPTDLLGDLLGPLPRMADAQTPTREEQEPSLLADALAAVWDDLEGPLTIASEAVTASRALFPEEPSEPAPAGGPDVTEEN